MTTMEAPSTAPAVAPAADAAEPTSAAAASHDERPARSRRSRLTTLAIMGVTALVIIAVVFLANQPSNKAVAEGLTSVSLSGAASGAAPEIGKPAPDFTAATADGATFTLSELKGHPVWLTFGASWCQPCRAEAPDIEAAYADFKAKGGQIVQVFLQEDAAAVTDYADRVGLTYLKVPDPNTDIATQYRILGIPSHFFIAADGTMQAMKVGSLDPAKIKAALAEIGG
jgi:cytochrome c biogenesis protein CcmG, thiol:disulfide interchange protein DsbE